MAGLIEQLNAKFAELEQSWVEAVSVNNRIKIGVTETARKAWKEAGSQRQPTASQDSIQALASYINTFLAENPESWVTCGVDSEVYFQSRGHSQIRTPTASSDDNKPLLRYWAARGRAQALRYLLSDVVGTEGWVYDPLSFSRGNEWKETLKADTSFSGPWHTLPVVRFSSRGPLVSQTEACARYLGAQFGIAGGNPNDAALADSLLCATYQVVTTISMKSLYASSPEDVLKELGTMKTTYVPYLDNLVEILGDKPFFVDASKPLYADYFVLDALQHVRAFLGTKHLSQRPTLDAYLARMEARPNIAAEIARTHETWCYSPNESTNWGIVRAQLDN